MTIRDGSDEIVQKPYSVPTRLPSIFQLKAGIKALRPTKTKRSQIDSLIAEAYAEIQLAIGDGVTKKAILAELALQGLKICPAKFKKLMEDEASRRGEIQVEEVA